ncbi:MAG: hypothetical protein U5K37_11500 [Natrialbaceae archaeon]|nr:hypothetical protein [Natrialbaceae archaeon]
MYGRSCGANLRGAGEVDPRDQSSASTRQRRRRVSFDRSSSCSAGSVEPGEVRLDHRVHVGDQEGVVDYSLEIDGDPAVFIIVSGTTSDIADRDVDRFRQYLRSDLPVDRVVLTNGVSYEVLVERASGEVARIGFDLEDLYRRPDLPTIIEKSRDHLRPGQSDGR